MTRRKRIELWGIGEPETWSGEGIHWACPEWAMGEGGQTMLVIDSHPERHVLARKARTEGLTTAHAISLEAALRHADSVEPDVVLVAYDEQTESVVTALRKRYPDVPILLWLDPADAREGLALVRRHGLHGAVSYDMAPEEIADEARRALGREAGPATREVIRRRVMALVERLER